MKNLKCYGITLVTLLLMAACAHLQPGPETESALKARVNAYWQHRLKGELAEAYLFEHPAVRERVSLTNYIRGLSSSGVLMQKVDTDHVSLAGDKATVRMTKTFKLHAIRSPRKGIPMKVTEYWELADGIWYRTRKEKTEPAPTYLPDGLVH